MTTARDEAFRLSSGNAALFHQWLVSPLVPDTLLTLFGVRRTAGPLAITVPADGDTPARTFEGNVHGPEVHSVRTLRRVGPDGTTRADLIVEITQSWHPAKDGDGLKLFRGGCTLIINRTTGMLDHLIRKRVDNGGRFGKQHSYVGAPMTGLRASYFTQDGGGNEPFAALHIPDFE